MAWESASSLLRRARRRAGLTQAELARRAGVTQSVLSAYERGRREPSVAALSKILAAAGLDLGLQRRLDLDRNGRLLWELLDLADSLPRRRRGELRYPPLARLS